MKLFNKKQNNKSDKTELEAAVEEGQERVQTEVETEAVTIEPVKDNIATQNQNPQKSVEEDFVIDDETAKILAEVAEVERGDNRYYSGMRDVASSGTIQRKEDFGKTVETFKDDVFLKYPIRLAATKDEKLAAREIRDSFNKQLKSPVRMEPFDIRPLAGKQGLPVYACIYLLCVLLYLIYAPVALPFIALLFAMLLTQVQFNLNVFDKIFPKKTSYNVVAFTGGEKKTTKTIVLGASYDSEYGRLNFGEMLNDHIKTKNAQIAVRVYFLASVAALLVFDVIKLSLMYATPTYKSGFSGGRLTMALLPIVLCAPAILYMALQTVYVKRYAKKQDANLTGAGTALAVLKHFSESKSELPRDCKLVVAVFGGNKAGIKGSEDFLRRHFEGGDRMLQNPVFIELGDLSGDGDFIVNNEDIGLRQKLDDKLEGKALELFKNQNLNAKSRSSLKLLDASNFAKRKIPSLSLSREVGVNTYDNTAEQGLDGQCQAIIELVKTIASEETI